MKKAYKVLIVVSMTLILSFIVWMNLTPGYFHRVGCCGGTVRYEQYNLNMNICAAVNCPSLPRFELTDLLLIFSIVDFNK